MKLSLSILLVALTALGLLGVAFGQEFDQELIEDLEPAEETGTFRGLRHRNLQDAASEPYWGKAYWAAKTARSANDGDDDEDEAEDEAEEPVKYWGEAYWKARGMDPPSNWRHSSSSRHKPYRHSSSSRKRYRYYRHSSSSKGKGRRPYRHSSSSRSKGYRSSSSSKGSKGSKSSSTSYRSKGH